VKAPTTVSKVLLADDHPGVMRQVARLLGARSRSILIVAVLSGAVALTGCKHLGPKTVSVDRFDYSTAIADSWKQQTLLRLAADRDRYVIAYSPVRESEEEIAVNSRSMLQIMQAFASYLDVPEAHRQDRSATLSLRKDITATTAPPVRIHSGPQKPTSAFAAVQYRDHWFWVDNDDLQTKRALTSVIFFFTLADTGAVERLPLVTIPAQ
jgi:DNA-binding NarL/FixJ family response regulator